MQPPSQGPPTGPPSPQLNNNHLRNHTKEKGLHVLLVLNLDIPLTGPQRLLLTIHAPIIPPDEHQITHTRAVAREDRDLGRSIVGGVRRAEGLWANDVAYAVC